MHSLLSFHKRHESLEGRGGLAAFLWGRRPGRARGGDLAGAAGVQGPGRAGLTKRPPGSPYPLRRLVPFLLLTLLFTLPAWAHEDHFADSDTRILVFSKTAGFRHDSIPAGIEALRGLGAENGFAVDATEDATRFTDEGLAPYAAVVFLNTTGDILNPTQEAAFERYIAAGNGYVGVHSAADTEYGWPWYGELVGAYFDSHPEIQNAQIRVSDPAHPSTASRLAPPSVVAK